MFDTYITSNNDIDVPLLFLCNKISHVQCNIGCVESVRNRTDKNFSSLNFDIYILQKIFIPQNFVVSFKIIN